MAIAYWLVPVLQAEQRGIDEFEEKVMRDRQEGLLFKSLYGNRKVEKRLLTKGTATATVCRHGNLWIRHRLCSLAIAMHSPALAFLLPEHHVHSGSAHPVPAWPSLPARPTLPPWLQRPGSNCFPTHSFPPTC